MLLLEEEKNPEPGDKLQMGLRALCRQTSNYVDRGYIKASFSLKHKNFIIPNFHKSSFPETYFKIKCRSKYS